jgi:hypothetical protein
MKGLFSMFCTKLTDGQIKRRVEYINKRRDELVAINRQKKEVVKAQDVCAHDDFRLYGDEMIGQATCKQCGKRIDFCDAVNQKMKVLDEKTNKLIAIIDIYESKLANLSPTKGYTP